MIRIKDTKYPSTAVFLSDAIKIAEYYGFLPIDELQKPAPVLGVPAAKKPPTAGEIEALLNFARRDERGLPAIARKAVLNGRGGGEALFAWRTVQSAGSVASIALELHVFGHASAIAEALLIVVGNAIAENAGIKSRVLSVIPPARAVRSASCSPRARSRYCADATTSSSTTSAR